MSMGIVLMSRAPIPGKTKTRLQTHFTGEECADLHKAFLQDLGQMLLQVQEQVPEVKLYLNYTPAGTEEMFQELVPAEFERFLQEGADLGEKMYHALNHAGQECEKQLIIGSDLPTLQPRVLVEAIQQLTEKDIVIGPSEDGGYYLLGTKEPVSFLFEDIIFGGGNVYQATIDAIREHGLTYGQVATWSDVDLYSEVVQLREELAEVEGWEYYPQATARKVEELLG